MGIFLFHPSNQEAEAQSNLYELKVSMIFKSSGQPELRSETLSPKQNKKQKPENKRVLSGP